MAALTVEAPKDLATFSECLQFRDKVYAGWKAYWPSSVRFELRVLQGATPFNEGRALQPFLVREGKRILARILAVIDAPAACSRREVSTLLLLFLQE